MKDLWEIIGGKSTGVGTLPRGIDGLAPTVGIKSTDERAELISGPNGGCQLLDSLGWDPVLVYLVEILPLILIGLEVLVYENRVPPVPCASLERQGNKVAKTSLGEVILIRIMRS